MQKPTPVSVWDWPTRLFHWLLVGLIGFSWWSAEMRHMDWHMQSGYAVLALIVFRLVWGFIGSSTSRFGTFVRSPKTVLAYLRSDNSSPKQLGHNPVGGYSVVIMLLLLAAQVGTGLFSEDTDGIYSGPLSYLVSYEQSHSAAEIHELSFTVLQAVIAVHVLAILFYLLVRKRNLIIPMMTGTDRQLDSASDSLRPASSLRFLIALILAGALAWYTSKGFR